MKQGDARRGRLYVALAAIAWSTAGLFQRELTVEPRHAARRPSAVRDARDRSPSSRSTERGRSVAAFRAIGRAGLAVAALMAVSSGSFIAALNYTSVANVLFMQALAPVLAAVLGTFVGEPVARRTWLAMAVAVAGVAADGRRPEPPERRSASGSRC